MKRERIQRVVLVVVFIGLLSIPLRATMQRRKRE
jgi:hypothetical protein